MHLDDSTLIQFALGILDKEESDRVDTALSESTELRNKLDEIQETLHTVALAEPPMQPNDRLKQRVLTSITPAKRFEGFTERFAELFDLAIKDVRQLLAKIDKPESDDWTSSVTLPGIDIMKFPGGSHVATSTCGLISVKPGTIFPRHRHQGEEWVFVLQGRARENDGRILRPGDLVLSESGSEHAFKSLGPETYIFAVLLGSDNKWLIGQSLLDRILGKRRFPAASEE